MVHTIFFNSEDFLHLALRPSEILLATSMLASEIKFQRPHHLYNEGIETSNDYGLPQPLNKSTNIYSVPSVDESSFNPTYYQKPMVPTSLLTLK